MAAASGLQATLWLALPLLGGGRRGLPAAPPVAGGRGPPAATVKQARFTEGLRVLRQSDYLTLMLLLILSVQLITTLVDYAYNGVVAQAYPDAAERTVVISDVYRVVNMAALALQLGAVAVLTLGLGRVFVGMPVLVGATVLALALHPVFLAAAAAKVVGKCVDYSLFRACKEMLYIPLSYAEKTQGKALVDILTYRISKGGAALALQGLLLVGLARWSMAVAVVLAVGWIGLAVLLVRRYRQRMAQTPAG
ncbi:MAG: Npt1/Npt2 family nucleotide transporter [bacterium]